MLTNAERMVRARLVLERRRVAVGDLLSPEIAASWSRCLDAGLDPTRKPQMVVVDDRQLKYRQEAIGPVHHLALAEIETLYHQIAGSNFLIAFSDADGTVLASVSDTQFGDSDAGRRIIAGSQWAETVGGTNALGTVIATGRPIVVHGAEHFYSGYGQICCAAAPVRAAGGELIGVLDASSDCASRQRHTLALVKMAAMHIEDGLFAQQMGTHAILAIHPRVEFLGTIGAGMMAIDDDGTIAAVNGRATAIMTGLPVMPGARFERVFREPFDKLLKRLRAGQPAFVRDTLGSLHAVAWLNRAAPLVRTGPLATLVREGGVRAPGREAVEPEFVADDPAVRETLQLVAAAVRVNAPILIQGETGSGKEVLARYAHSVSGRKGNFVAINCAAMPENLFESELFGYATGAFTGARKGGAEGLIASADRGTLLLDEISALPQRLQATLLRFLDDHVVRAVGGRGERVVDLQILAATNVDLAAEVAAGRFRADLLYRLDMIKAALPPLRDRFDFPAALHFTLARIDPRAVISPDAAARLAEYSWPGNFRELRAVLTRALLGARDRNIGLPEVSAWLPRTEKKDDVITRGALRETMAQEVVREYRRLGGNVSRTARNLAISRNTVYHHLRAAASNGSSSGD